MAARSFEIRLPAHSSRGLTLARYRTKILLRGSAVIPRRVTATIMLRCWYTMAKQFVVALVLGNGVLACAPGARRHPFPSSTQGTMSDPLAFDFTEAEIYAAFRLVAPDAEARQGARAFARAYDPGLDWGASERTLLLLSLGTDTGNGRVERIRRALQEDRYPIWLAEEGGRDARSAGDLSSDWADHIAAEDREWAAKRAELRRALREQGKIPPE